MLREEIEWADAWGKIETIAFFAVAPDRSHESLIPIYATNENGQQRLQTKPPADRLSPRPLFFALPRASSATSSDAAATGEFNSSALVELYEYRRKSDNAVTYATRKERDDAGFERAGEPLCRVWRNPMTVHILSSDPARTSVPGAPYRR
jgi:hypothetical protein